MSKLSWTDPASKPETVERTQGTSSVLVTNFEDELHVTTSSEIHCDSLKAAGEQLVAVATAMTEHGHYNSELYVELRVHYL